METEQDPVSTVIDLRDTDRINIYILPSILSREMFFPSGTKSQQIHVYELVSLPHNRHQFL